MTNSSPPPRRRSLFWTVWLLIGAALLVAYFVWKPNSSKPDNPPPDPVAAAHANARGIGHIEQFQFPQAAAAFEEAAALAPDWLPAKINRGIALLNSQVTADLDRALALFTEVLRVEPDNAHALYCSGIIHFYRNDLEAAHRFFTRVTEIDPRDAHAWYYRGRTRPDESDNPDAKKDYETALACNPYLNAARYTLAQHGHNRDEEKSRALLAEWENLGEKGADWEDVAKIEYIYMGRYGEVIGASPARPPAVGPVPMFEHRPPVAVAAGVAGEADPLAKAVRDRFGLAVTLLDYNRDGRADVFLPGTRPVLLQNDGNNAVKDVTAELGLGKLAPVFGVAAADFDNDGRPDLLFTGPAGVRLYRNADGKRFEDKTGEGGLDAEKGVCLGAAWVDLDQDGDLDLVVAKYADSPDRAAKLLAGEKLDGGGRLVVFANVGTAPPVPPGQNLPPISCKFRREDWPDALKLAGPFVAVVAADTDGDKDVDLVVLGDGGTGDILLNDRLMRFRRLGLAGGRPDARPNGGLVLDATVEDPSDQFTIAAAARPTVSLGKKAADGSSLGATDSPPLKQAHRTDLDRDGRADVVGLSADGKPVFLHGDGAGKLTLRPEAFGPAADSLSGVAGVAVADFDGDGPPDLLAIAADGLHVFRNLGNGNRGLRLVATGRRHRGETLRTNADAVGAKVVAHAGPLRAGAELTTLAAGLGQSHLPLHLGLGKATTAEAVRLRWPDQVVQAELNQPTDRIIEIVETKRNQGSCPILFTWDGRHFAYVTDFLGGGAVGETGPDGSIRPPRPEESVKIEADQLVPRDGQYVVKVTEPMDEVMYLDHLRLTVIDHPKEAVVFPDERFATADPQPTQQLLAFRERFAPAQAVDHRGRDATAKLRQRDRDAVDGFAVRSWLGFAEEHWVELDFGNSLAPLRVAAKPRLFFVLAGWTEYAYPESIYAATQAGVPMVTPVLEQRQPDGSWEKLDELGFPAGLMRVMTKDVTGLVDPAGGPVRIRTNLRIYWDQIFLAPLAGPDAMTVHELPVARANLAYAGFAQEVTPGGKPPVEYDHDRREVVSVTPWKGRLTRFGDVTELLTTTDDRHVIAGPGDEVTAEFDAASLPPVRAGWVRSFVLRTAGYCKDTAPTTSSGGLVGPVPYRGMPTYPYEAGKEPPHVVEYDRKWNTRPANGGTSRRWVTRSASDQF